MQDAILGAWTLRTFTVEDVDTSERSEPFGAAPRGVMMFDPGGRMSAILTPRERAEPASDADRVQAFQQMVACSGLYRPDPPDRFVIAVDVAWFEPWVGSEQVRRYQIKGDRLDVVSTPTRLPRPGGPDATVVATLSWVREGSR